MSLEDVKLNLQDTDYEEVLQGDKKVSITYIRDKFLHKLVTEFEFLRAGAQQPLGQFLDYISYDYMIDNVMLILKATHTNPNVNLSGLIHQIHPLGKFKPATLKSIVSAENSAEGFKELFKTVLIDTPIGKYFSGAKYDESMTMIKLESTVRSLYLEDFYFFCKKLGGDTAISMMALLEVRADEMTINITLNSFSTPLNEPNARNFERKSLFPSIGKLYPEGIDKLSSVGDELQLGNLLKNFPIYKLIFEKHQNGEKLIDDAFYEYEVLLNEIMFEGQFNFSCFYSYLRLREQEIRNIVWICECIIQRQKKRIDDHFVPIFSKDAPYRMK